MSNQIKKARAIRECIDRVQGGGTPSRTVSTFWKGSIPWASVKDFTDDSLILSRTKETISEAGLKGSTSKSIQPGTPIACIRMAVGRCAIPTRPVAINQDLKALLLRDDVNPYYFIYALRHKQPALNRCAIGSTVKGISTRDLLSTTVYVPAPNEQRRIAEILDTLDEAIRRTEEVIEKLRRMKQGLLHDLLTRGLDANGELRDPDRHPEQFKDSPLGRIPREWEVVPLTNLAHLPSGQLSPRIEPYRSWTLVAPDHIESGTGRLLNRTTAGEQGAISGKYGFESGDIIYSKIRPYLRKAILATFQGLCSADMYPLRPRAEVNPRFLLAVMLGEQFSRFAEGVSMRSGFPKINRKELAEYRTAFPPLAEQREIGRILEEFDDRESSEEKELSKLRTLKQGLMDDLLTGRVRVSTAEKVSA